MAKYLAHYPDGAAGMALVLLRVSCGAVAFCITPIVPGLHANFAIFLSAVVVLFLLVGLFVRYGALFFAAAILLEAATTSALSDARLLGLFGASIALALLGPGAYSIDARRFGRRVIRLQYPRSRE